jgi:hypothetical protein
VEYSLRKRAHLGMLTLLAGVASKGDRQSSYLLECFQEVATRCVTTHRALNPIRVAAGSYLTHFAAGANDGMRSGS